MTSAATDFTGKERDGEKGLDSFGARYSSGAQGRFISADLPLYDQDTADPLSWNLFSYVRNNPLRYIDPTGRGCVSTQSGHSSTGIPLWTNTNDPRVPGPSCGEIDRQDAQGTPSVRVHDFAPPGPFLLAVAQGAQRAESSVNLAGAATAIVASGAFAGMGFGAIAGGAGLQQLGVAAGPAAYSLLPEIGRKLDCLFGLAKGSVHNIQRSTSMLGELQPVGLNDTAEARSYVQAHLGRVLNDARNIVSPRGGRTVRESFLMGPTGSVRLETVWEGTKLSTMKVIGGGR